MATSKAFGGKRELNPRVRSELFVARKNKQTLMSFADLDPALVICALNVGMLAGATISFAPAQGGLGVTLRVYRGDYADTEFAGSPEELTELLMIIIKGLYEGADDPLAVTRLVLQQKGSTK